MAYVRYHIELGAKRTTVSLDEPIADMLAFKLGSSPEAENAHLLVREWLQRLVNQRRYKGTYRLSQLSATLREHAIMYLMDNKLSKRYWRWRLK